MVASRVSYGRGKFHELTISKLEVTNFEEIYEGCKNRNVARSELNSLEM